MIDAYVIGDDLTALVAALDLAEVGLSVRVGVTGEDLPVGPIPDNEGSLRALCETLAAPVATGGRPHEGLLPVESEPERTALQGRSGQWGIAPTPAVLGIPAVPLSVECTALLGWGSAVRAYLDRVKPVLTIGKTRLLDALVNTRIGPKARALLVDPVVYERFGRAPSEVEVALAVPGLNETVSRTGSLTGAVLAYSERNVARETKISPREGWPALRRALIERLGHYSVDVVAERVTAVTRIHETDAGDDAEQFQLSCQSLVATGDEQPETMRVRSVVVGTRTSSLLAGEDAALMRALDIAELAPQHVRVHADADILGSEGASSVVGGAAEVEATLRLLRAHGVGGEGRAEVWSVRERAVSAENTQRTTAATAPAPTRTSLRGPSVPAASLQAAIPPRPEASQNLETDERLTAALVPAELLGLATSTDSVAQDEAQHEAVKTTGRRTAETDAAELSRWNVSIHAAPFATHKDRDRQLEALGRHQEANPTVLATGAALYGGDLSHALQRAREQAVELRRRLLGLAE